jgi:hypothetical protein
MREDSRYIDADSRFVAVHTYDEAGVREKEEEGERPKTETRAVLYRLPVLPAPEPPDETYMVKITDNYPLLAKRVFNDPEKWWVFAESNPQIRHPLDLKATDVIFVPS